MDGTLVEDEGWHAVTRCYEDLFLCKIFIPHTAILETDVVFV